MYSCRLNADNYGQGNAGFCSDVDTNMQGSLRQYTLLIQMMSEKI